MAETNKDTNNQDKKTIRNVQSNVVHRIVIWVVGIIIALLIIVGFMGYRYVRSSFGPVNESATATVNVKIPIGSTNKDIATLLEDRHVIKSAVVFDYYVKSRNYTDFQAGTYSLKQSMSLQQVIAALRTDNGSVARPVAHVLVREGVTAEDIADTMSKYTKKDKNLTKKSFMKVMRSKSFFKQMAAKYPALLSSATKAKGVRYRLEGYLFPATYDVSKNMTAEKLVESMIAKSDSTLSPLYKSIDQKGFTVQQVLTLASLVEREGVTENSRRMIAGVFLNRIDVKMPLQSDLTVMYALNTHKKHLTNKDTAVNSPYNLYKHTGYGPGPFNQPSLESVRAVLNPAERSAGYLYFVANMKTGKILYGRTLSEQNANIAAIGSDNN
ncbi:endolytic transglycosylase MltG [Lacticaseibacillus zhaodongensis]|uniref:endolytic transglycosylase MltG n=1 Tax=Lacticaseibacillus zhaodongensis TaxID=2668065 RepID=UPI0012D2AE7C|nr:endolytic transglycosylase MltG [Lacticaseibacillus zhaodongensis]